MKRYMQFLLLATGLVVTDRALIPAPRLATMDAGWTPEA